MSIPTHYADILASNGFEPSMENLIVFFETTLSEQILLAARYKRGCSEAYLAGFVTVPSPGEPFKIPHDAARDEK